MFEYGVQLVHLPLRRRPRARFAPSACAFGLALLAAGAGYGRERTPAHPTDESEVFTGGEVITPGPAVKPPAIAYWKVRATFRVPPGERQIRVGVLVPLSDGRQNVLARRTHAPGFRLHEATDAGNLRAEWTGAAPSGATIAYDVAVRVAETATAVPAVPLASLPPPPADSDGLASPAGIPSVPPAVARRARRVIGTATRLDEIVWALYQYTATFGAAVDPAGPQDAQSVLAAR